MTKIAACIAAGLSLTMLSGPALCADVAQVSVLGFSPDAKVFAFEEYGIQDGSGFPYSTVYFIDTEKDAYLPGTPYRIIVDDGEAEDDLLPVSVARKRSAKAAHDLLEKYKIADDPGILGAFNPTSEIGAPEYELSYYTVQMDNPFSGAYTLKLDPVSFPSPENCGGLSDHYSGFQLSFTQIEGKATNLKVYADDHVPQSRGCVGGYRLAGVALSESHKNPHIALVELRTFGFEGFDLRWIAVPVRAEP